MVTMPRWLGLAAMVLAAAGGCSKGVSIKTVPVTGKVTLDGQPLSGATITFLPAESGSEAVTRSPSSGMTGADGSYKLLTMASGRDVADGVPPGNYKVIVIKTAGTPDAAGPKALDPTDPLVMDKMATMSGEELEKMRMGPRLDSGSSGQLSSAGPKSEIPERYGKADTSGLAATVGASGAQTFDFPLTSK